MSSIGGIGSYSATMQDPAQFRSMRRPDPEAMASKAFAQIDTASRGYIEKADLQSAIGRSGSTDGVTSTASVDDLFAKLDGDGDGKVTQQEFSSGATSLADELRQHGPMGAMGGMPPGPPPGGADGAGFTKDELSSQLDEIDSSGDPRAKLISSLVDNFEAADADRDGKVSFSEARTFAASQASGSEGSSGSTTGSSSGGGSSSSSTTASDQTVGLAQQMMRLLHSYTVASTATSASSLSLSA